MESSYSSILCPANSKAGPAASPSKVGGERPRPPLLRHIPNWEDWLWFKRHLEGWTMTLSEKTQSRSAVRSRYKRHDRTEKDLPEEPTPTN